MIYTEPEESLKSAVKLGKNESALHLWLLNIQKIIPQNIKVDNKNSCISGIIILFKIY